MGIFAKKKEAGPDLAVLWVFLGAHIR